MNSFTLTALALIVIWYAFAFAVIRFNNDPWRPHETRQWRACKFMFSPLMLIPVAVGALLAVWFVLTEALGWALEPRR